MCTSDQVLSVIEDLKRGFTIDLDSVHPVSDSMERARLLALRRLDELTITDHRFLIRTSRGSTDTLRRMIYDDLREVIQV